MTEQEINEEFRSIISHALLGYEDNISKEDWELVFTECTKYATKLISEQQSAIQELTDDYNIMHKKYQDSVAAELNKNRSHTRTVWCAGKD